jgi:hypothetical protein
MSASNRLEYSRMHLSKKQENGSKQRETFATFLIGEIKPVTEIFIIMIERYTIKFAPAVSQKELEKKMLEEKLTEEDEKQIHLLRVRIEVIGDISDLKKLSELLKQLHKPAASEA